jgi:molybdate transport repressor ModE-like protein
MKNSSGSHSDIRKLKSKIGLGVKVWLEFNNGEPRNILGSGWAKLLNKINMGNKNEKYSLTSAAEDCGYSYKYAWNILKRIEQRTGLSPVETGKGGPGGGGWVKLNEWGLLLLNTYNKVFEELKKIEKNLDSFIRLEN